MKGNGKFQLFAGRGEPASARGTALAPFEPLPSLEDPSQYLADDGLRDAVNVALQLGMPLLLAGEPGVGKSRLAGAVAWELGLGEPLVFSAKTDSVAKDLFFRYDAIRHFHDVQVKKDAIDPRSYIRYQALGVAVQKARGETPCRSVVLIDEIDKAPRDFPNDILTEIESFSFQVPETGDSFQADPRFRPIVFLTSNSEKNLPDAFLRRCLYFHIPFPSPERLRQIVMARLPESHRLTGAALDRALEYFYQMRQFALRKRPSTAECLSWLTILAQLEINIEAPEPGDLEALALSFAAVAKNAEDLAYLQLHFSKR